MASASRPPALILAIMILPLISSISRDVFNTVPPVLKEAAFGIGCTRWEVMRKIVAPYTGVGLVGGIMLALGRALGETMAVTFVIGNAHKIAPSILGPGTTISATIANEFTEADGAIYTSSLIALGLLLFVITFIVLAASRLLLMRIEEPGSALKPCPRSSSRAQDAQRHRHGACASPPAGVGLLALAFILGALLYNGFAGLNLRVFTENTPPPGSAGGLLNAIVGSLIMTFFGVADRRAARHVRRHLHGRIWPQLEADHGGALHQRHPAVGALHRHRPVRL